jgi:hypothetical protein
MNTQCPAFPPPESEPIASDRLAEGLTLLRASTLKIVRLQLAMERHDRRVALEAVDDLVVLDRRLQDYLAMVPAAEEQLLFRHELDAERALLNREKLGLTAEVLRRPPPAPTQEQQPAEDDWLGPRELEIAEDEPRGRLGWLVAIPIIVASVGGSVAYFLGLLEVEAWLIAAGLR